MLLKKILTSFASGINKVLRAMSILGFSFERTGETASLVSKALVKKNIKDVRAARQHSKPYPQHSRTRPKFLQRWKGDTPQLMTKQGPTERYHNSFASKQIECEEKDAETLPTYLPNQAFKWRAFASPVRPSIWAFDIYPGFLATIATRKTFVSNVFYGSLLSNTSWRLFVFFLATVVVVESGCGILGSWGGWWETGGRGFAGVVRLLA